MKRRLFASFSGTVQGVGFRYTTARIARGFATVTGYVRNLPDGRVEIIAEGDAKEIDEFHEAIKHAMAGYIRDESVQYQEATGQFEGFGITG